jgi:hypothetical protein
VSVTGVVIYVMLYHLSSINPTSGADKLSASGKPAPLVSICRRTLWPLS